MRNHLRFKLRNASECGVKEHPQVVMRQLGIDYQMATPQSLGDQWWFWNCTNLPNPLPDYLEILNMNPFDAIGQGLSHRDAKEISEFE